MRNWFVLFTTSFTITTLVLVVAISFLNMEEFDSRYVLLLAIISALLSLFMNMPTRLQIKSLYLTVLLDIAFIFTIVFSTAVIIGLHPITFANFILTLSLVIVIYIIITLIYMFILTKEAEDMNKKISNWRKKHVDR